MEPLTRTWHRSGFSSLGDTNYAKLRCERRCELWCERRCELWWERRCELWWERRWERRWEQGLWKCT